IKQLSILVVTVIERGAVGACPTRETPLLIITSFHVADARPVHGVPIKLRLVTVVKRNAVAIIGRQVSALCIVLERTTDTASNQIRDLAVGIVTTSNDAI